MYAGRVGFAGSPYRAAHGAGRISSLPPLLRSWKWWPWAQILYPEQTVIPFLSAALDPQQSAHAALTVLTGFLGQVSLAQAAFAGMGGFLLAKLLAAASVPQSF